MIELVIANNDEMALGAISALQESGYNKAGGKTIPVFGIDATEGAIAKIKDGAMAGTIKQDAEGMAKMIIKVAKNMIEGKNMLDGVDKDLTSGTQRINIPSSKISADEEK